jgi:hypothetical protein
MMFDLWTAVTFFRFFRTAYSKAAFTIRSVPEMLIGLIEIPESGRIPPARAQDLRDQFLVFG